MLFNLIFLFTSTLAEHSDYVKCKTMLHVVAIDLYWLLMTNSIDSPSSIDVYVGRTIFLPFLHLSLELKNWWHMSILVSFSSSHLSTMGEKLRKNPPFSILGFVILRICWKIQIRQHASKIDLICKSPNENCSQKIRWVFWLSFKQGDMIIFYEQHLTCLVLNKSS